MPTIVTILTETYADWECALTLAAARTYFGFTTITATQDGQVVTSAGGLKVTPDIAIEDINGDDLDILLINGGQSWEDGTAPDISTLVLELHAKEKTIGAICAATRILAQTGLLNKSPHTSNNLEFLQSVKGYDGAALYVDTPGAVAANGLITAAGTAPVSFMRKVMEALDKGGPELEFYLDMYAAEHR